MTGYERLLFVAEFYDHIPRYRRRPDVEFYVETARQCGGPVLELGCGTGRVLIPVARAGTEIVGLDSAASMLNTCRVKLGDEAPEVRRRVILHHGDMRGFDLKRTFRLVTIPFRSFQHLHTVDDELACLAAVRRHLTADGKVALDVFNPSLDYLSRLPEADERDTDQSFSLEDGRVVTCKVRMWHQDVAAQLLDGDLIYEVLHPDGSWERLTHQIRWRYVFRFELEHLLARAGFKVEQIYSGFDRSTFGAQYPGELVVIASRADRGPRDL